MKKGFTLLELIIVIIIIGILVTLALPRFTSMFEKAKLADGKAALGAIRAGQLRYYSLNSNIYDTDGACKYLDVTVTASNVFTVPSCADANATTGKGLAKVTRKTGQYTLVMDDDGTINCSGGTTITCATAGCTTTCP